MFEVNQSHNLNFTNGNQENTVIDENEIVLAIEISVFVWLI